MIEPSFIFPVTLLYFGALVIDLTLRFVPGMIKSELSRVHLLAGKAERFHAFAAHSTAPLYICSMDQRVFHGATIARLAVM